MSFCVQLINTHKLDSLLEYDNPVFYITLNNIRNIGNFEHCSSILVYFSVVSSFDGFSHGFVLLLHASVITTGDVLTCGIVWLTYIFW